MLMYVPFILYLGLMAILLKVETDVMPLTTHSKLAYAHADAGILPCSFLVGWFTPPLPWDGGMARTAIPVHANNLIQLG